MPLKQYGVLKGRPIGRLRDADDDHYQILVTDGKTQHRIAVNVKSSAPNAPSDLLFQSVDQLPSSLTKALKAAKNGYSALKSKPGGIAQDFVRGGIADPTKMVPVPPDKPGAKNDLKDTLEDRMKAAMDDDKAVIYAFGEKWGPEKKKKDQYFHFKPGNGIHDIHMNQGNSGKWKKDNGTWQDGCLMIEYSGNKWFALFLTFQSQTFSTDDKGNPVKMAAKKAAK
ncbi:MAG: YukJ family protein [Acidobacteria bacterium]|nr:YukJ family protein [Acidobacteriota bacterium]